MTGHLDAANADIPDWDRMSRVRVGYLRKQARIDFRVLISPDAPATLYQVDEEPAARQQPWSTKR